MEQNNYIKRIIVLFVILIVSILISGGRLYNLQIVNGEEYLKKSERRISRTVNIKAPRGEILDRYGRPLVTNRMSFTIRFDALTWEKSQKDKIISELIALCGQSGNEYIDTLPVSKTAPFFYTYTPGENSQDEIRTVEYLRGNNWPDNTRPDELINLMCGKYSIADNLPDNQKRAVAGVCFEMEAREFSRYTPYTFAQDVDINLVTRIKEQSRNFPGVFIEVEPIREYETEYAAHLLGRVGLIYKEEYADLKKKGYRMDDLVGKDGMEKALEEYLRGVDGFQSIETTTSGKLTNIIKSEDPILGKNCMLTIDIKVQEAAEKSLAAIVPKLRAEGKTNRRWGGEDAKGAALVAIDVKTGGILASASYPGFSLKTFNKDYRSLSTDPLKPLINRAISGMYPPGSTFKMITALAGLESGAITTTKKIYAKGIYTYYAPSYTPMCDIYRTYGRIHGNINVSEAIKVSCNYFFYETGRLATIEKLEEYAAKFGLGEPTGVEIPGESRGKIAGPSERKKVNKSWYRGETLAAAIGQSDTMVTPIQLANYIATLVNGGTRYKPYFLKSVKDANTNATLFETQPEVKGKVELNEKNLKAVLSGMHMAAQETGGTAASTFLNYPVTVGAKTGSAQAPGGSHAVFVAFAPYDDPEIAVAVVVENGGQGSRISSVARDVFDAYFSSEDAMESRVPEFQLLQ
jgi:penicillin-binding protein 2